MTLVLFYSTLPDTRTDHLNSVSHHCHFTSEPLTSFATRSFAEIIFETQLSAHTDSG